MEVMLEEQRYETNIALIEQRSVLLLNHAFPLLSDAGVHRGENRPIAEIANILGENIVQQLKELTRGTV
jgi:hypothetical protein